MGMLEVVMLAMIGRMVVLGMERGMQMILEFANGLNLVICNTLFMKQEFQLVTYAAGPVKSTVDYIIVRQEDKAKVRNIKVIPKKTVPKHKLLVMDKRFNTTKRWHKKFEPKVHVWKLEEEET